MMSFSGTASETAMNDEAEDELAVLRALVLTGGSMLPINSAAKSGRTHDCSGNHAFVVGWHASFRRSDPLRRTSVSGRCVQAMRESDLCGFGNEFPDFHAEFRSVWVQL